jgi:hypothetical protein
MIIYIYFQHNIVHVDCLKYSVSGFTRIYINGLYLRNKSWKSECALSSNMYWRIKFTKGPTI